jgi:hypothetical protein
MAKIKFNGSWPVELPVYGNRLVGPGDVIEVPDDHVDGFQGEDWEVVDAPKATRATRASIPDVVANDAGTAPASTVEG